MLCELMAAEAWAALWRTHKVLVHLKLETAHTAFRVYSL